jgi:hypothetical protein
MTSPAPVPATSPERPASTGAHATIQVGDSLVLEAAITTRGLLAVATIVGSALLGSAAIVLAARHTRR